jgi:hypothetical protein
MKLGVFRTGRCTSGMWRTLRWQSKRWIRSSSSLTHEAHSFVPYGRPQMLVTKSVGGLSVIPTSWRQATTPVITLTTATSPSLRTRRPI